MKYKVGDKVISGDNKGKITKGPYIDNSSGNKVAIVRWSNGSKTEEYIGNLSPDYRALYEREKELREALEAYMALTEKTYSGNPMEKVHLAHYQQLKSKYNGQDTGTA